MPKSQTTRSMAEILSPLLPRMWYQSYVLDIRGRLHAQIIRNPFKHRVPDISSRANHLLQASAHVHPHHSCQVHLIYAYIHKTTKMIKHANKIITTADAWHGIQHCNQFPRHYDNSIHKTATFRWLRRCWAGCRWGAWRHESRSSPGTSTEQGKLWIFSSSSSYPLYYEQNVEINSGLLHSGKGVNTRLTSSVRRFICGCGRLCQGQTETASAKLQFSSLN